MQKWVTFGVLQGDARAIAADVLVLKYAQQAHGLEREVIRRLIHVWPDVALTLPAIEHHLVLSTQGSIAADSVLFMGVPPLHDFQYAEIRQFGRRSLEVLASAAPAVRHVAMTIHGPGYGLDETEAFHSQLAGIFDALDAGTFPKALERITVVENSAQTAERLSELMRETVPGNRVLVSGAMRTEPAPAAGSTASVLASLADVGGASASKPNVFVAMPFAPEYDDHFHFGIQGAVHAAGFLCERADLASFAGDVMEWVKLRIGSASLVVADLSSANPNVYLEVGFAWGRGVPTVLLVRDAKELMFNTRGQRCLVYKSIRDLKEQLERELDSFSSAVRR